VTSHEAIACIATVRWRFASTMPDWPHEHTVKAWRPDLAADCEAFCESIEVDGSVEAWPPPLARPIYHHRYKVMGEHRYWEMGPRGDWDAVAIQGRISAAFR
jgi:hypothetical protein